LFWGVLGAIVFRLTFILAGTALLKKFHWVVYIFGIIVIVSGIKLLMRKDEEIDPERNPVLRLARRFLPITPNYHGQKFFVRLNGKFMATPLTLVLLVVESTDIVFAVDSIPAIFAITRDPFIVFTSNVCAILGLRALYFLLEGMIRLFRYLDEGLAVILVFIGIKMLVSEFYKIPTWVALGFVAAVLAITIALSLMAERREQVRVEKLEPQLNPNPKEEGKGKSGGKAKS
jgi:tellurite resistance protein TerC